VFVIVGATLAIASSVVDEDETVGR